MSLGGQGIVDSIAVAVDSAVAAGVTVVVAGGNSNSDAFGFSPAFVPSAITVGSTDSNDVRSGFSNYGSCTDVWAPGSDVESASHKSDGGYVSFSGTSMACPHVAGAAALVLIETAQDGPTAVLESILKNSAKGEICDLKSGDTNALLYVGDDGPPAESGKECPATPPCPSDY